MKLTPLVAVLIGVLSLNLAAQKPNCEDGCVMSPVETAIVNTPIEVLGITTPPPLNIGTTNVVLVPEKSEFVLGECKPDNNPPKIECVSAGNCAGSYTLQSGVTFRGIGIRPMLVNTITYIIDPMGRVTLLMPAVEGNNSKTEIPTISQACGETTIVGHQWVFVDLNGMKVMFSDTRINVSCTSCPDYIPPVGGLKYSEALVATRAQNPASLTTQLTGIDLF